MLQEVKENWQDRYRHWTETDESSHGRNVAVKTQISDGYLDQVNSYLQT